MTTSTKQKPGDRVLSVREAVEYIDATWHRWPMPGGRPHLFSESSVRRYLSTGHWAMTRTAAGHYGTTVRDLRKRFQTVKVKHPRPLTPRQQARLDRDCERSHAFIAQQRAAGLVWDDKTWQWVKGEPVAMRYGIPLAQRP